MSEISDRICQIRKQKGLSQSDVADSLGVSTRTYQRFEKNPDDLDKVRQIASIFDVSYEWIVAGIDKASCEVNENMVSVSVYRAGAGDGIYNYEPSNFILAINTEMFPYIDRHNISAIEIDGDSMEPKLRHGDYILISPVVPDREKEDGIYAIRVDGSIKVKALQFMLDGSIQIISYNKAYQTEVYDPKESQVDFEILGKMRLLISR